MISIVILNWHGSKMMKKYLPSVIEHSEGAEIVVADNASTDDSIALLKKEFHTVRTIILEKKWGFADGYNKAFEALERENTEHGTGHYPTRLLPPAQQRCEGRRWMVETSGGLHG